MRAKTITCDDVAKIWLTESAVWIELRDGRRASADFDDYPRLKSANGLERTIYQLSQYGIHWPDIDEDLSFEGFFRQ